MAVTTDPTARLLGDLGLCARARALIFGTAMVCEALRAPRRPHLVLEASDTSEGTHKRLCDKCRFYGVSHHRIPVTADRLASALGKSGLVAAVAITDRGLCRPVLDALAALSAPKEQPNA